MEMYRTYMNLRVKEEAYKDQISITKHELYMYYGIDFDSGDGIPGGKVAYKYGMNTAITQIVDRINYIKRHQILLKSTVEKRKRLEKFLKSLDGLEYEIAYKRIVEGKLPKNIAEELSLSIKTVYNTWHEIGGPKLDLRSIEPW